MHLHLVGDANVHSSSSFLPHLILFKYLRITVESQNPSISICDVNKQHSIINFMVLGKKDGFISITINSHFNLFYLSFKEHFYAIGKRANEIIPSELAPRRNFCLV